MLRRLYIIYFLSDNIYEATPGILIPKPILYQWFIWKIGLEGILEFDRHFELSKLWKPKNKKQNSMYSSLGETRWWTQL